MLLGNGVLPFEFGVEDIVPDIEPLPILDERRMLPDDVATLCVAIEFVPATPVIFFPDCINVVSDPLGLVFTFIFVCDAALTVLEKVRELLY